jgi:hypothetical protein
MDNSDKTAEYEALQRRVEELKERIGDGEGVWGRELLSSYC